MGDGGGDRTDESRVENWSRPVFLGSADIPPLPRGAVMLKNRLSKVRLLLLRSEADGGQRRSPVVSSSCSVRGRAVSQHGSEVTLDQAERQKKHAGL